MNIILIGGDQTTYFLAREFISQEHGVTLINRDPEDSRIMSRKLKATVLLGEGSDPETLEQAGARSADVLIAMTSHDHDNLIACQVARLQFEVPRTIALVNDPQNESVFEGLGISVAFSATRIIASLLNQQTRFAAITHLMTLGQGQINLTEVLLSDKSPAAGKTLHELDLPENFLVAAVLRGDAVLVPRGPTRLAIGDKLIVVGAQADFKTLLTRLAGD
ncbi:MAG: TrkA family potassium uptake protein [Desulfobacteraceae bacterium]|jgi:trk system potassium uptake protein TrkA